MAGLWPRRPGFDLRSVHVRFMVGEVVLAQVILRVFRLCPVRIMTSTFRTHASLYIVLIGRTSGASL